MEKKLTWMELNKQLLKMKDPAAVLALFESERGNGKRKLWLKRIWARYTKLRSQEEKRRLKLS